MGKCLSNDRIKCVHDLNVNFILILFKIHVQSLILIGQLVKMDEKCFMNGEWHIQMMDEMSSTWMKIVESFLKKW